MCSYEINIIKYNMVNSLEYNGINLMLLSRSFLYSIEVETIVVKDGD